MIFKFICNLFILIQFIVIINGQCTESDYERADQAFLIVSVFSDPNTLFPTDDQTMTKQCKIFSDEQNYLKQFARKCLNAFTKQTFGLLLRGVSKELKKYCSKKLRNDFLNHNKCGLSSRNDAKKCMDQFSKELKQISIANQDLKIELLCCSNYAFVDCIYKNMASNSQCSNESAKAFQKLAHGYSEDTVGLICPGIEPGSSKCIASVKKFKKLPINSIKSDSVLLPFLEVIKSITIE